MTKTYFILNQDGELEINVPEVRKTPIYEELFKRDKYSPGDAQGTKKLIATAEIYYIFLISDIRSSIYSLPIKERKLKAKELAKLPDKWKEDDLLLQAIEQYKKDFKLTASGKAYATAEANYYSLAEDTEYLSEELVALKELLRDKLKKVKTSSIGNTEVGLLAKEIVAIIENCSKQQKVIMGNIKEFANLDKTVKELANKFIQEGGSFKIPIGNRELGNREK